MFFGDLLLLKENHLFYEKKKDFTQKVTCLSFSIDFRFLIEKRKINTIYISFLWNCTKYPFLTVFGRLNTFCRKQLLHVTIYFFYLKFHKLRFFQFLRVLTALYIKPPFTSITWDLNYQFFNVFKGFTIFLCQIHLPLENKSMFLHPKVSFQ